MVDCSKRNKFKPNNREYFDDYSDHKDNQKVLAYLSNPHNPTGIVRSGLELKEFV